ASQRAIRISPLLRRCSACSSACASRRRSRPLVSRLFKGGDAAPKEAAAAAKEAQGEEEKKEQADDKDKEKDKEAKDGKAAGDAPAPAPAQRTVKSVVLTGYGGIEKMKVKAWPLASAPAAGQVEVAVSHCGVNYADVCMRRGVQRERAPPCVMGLECAGTVSAVGEGVDTLQPGDRVLCYQHTGDLYRETVVVPATNVFILPEGMSLEHGAAITVDYLTAYFCLMDFANLRPGQSVLINSCAEGVGWAATQLAKTVEDVVIFGAAAASKHDAVKENGVTHPLNIESVEQELHAISPQGVDIIIDSSTGSNVSANLRLLKPLGRLIIIGTSSVVTGHQKPGFMDMLRNLWSVKTLSTMDLVMGNRSVAGFHLGKIFEQMPERFNQVLEYVFNLYAQERIRPRIDSEVPLEQVVDAAKRLAERENIGKVLLKVNAETKNAEE
ncbi:Enoyl-[acyl-carrier-protein] reductase, mitochondrial, partial [Gryllus bimaculatus]